MKFSPKQDLSDVGELSNEIIKVFKVQKKQFIVQMKWEEWGGEFVDVSEVESIPEHSVLRTLFSENITVSTLVSENKEIGTKVRKYGIIKYSQISEITTDFSGWVCIG